MFASLITVRRAGSNPAGTDIQGGRGGVWQTPATTKNQQADNRIVLKKKKIKAEYNSAEKDKVKRDPIPRKKTQSSGIISRGRAKYSRKNAREESKENRRGDLAGFCDTQFMPRVGDIIQRRIYHRKWELNLHISDFFCIFAAEKHTRDKKDGEKQWIVYRSNSHTIYIV